MIIQTSYFYQIRFFKPNMVPLSTAAFDPKWFHAGRGPTYQFKDKRGIWNGIRAEPFCATNAIPFNECGCPLCDTHDPDSCDFLARYRAYLDSLSFVEIYQRFVNFSKKVQQVDQSFVGEPVLVLIFYETPRNRCSERTEVTKWFHAHNYPIKEVDYPIL